MESSGDFFGGVGALIAGFFGVAFVIWLGSLLAFVAIALVIFRGFRRFSQVSENQPYTRNPRFPFAPHGPSYTIFVSHPHSRSDQDAGQPDAPPFAAHTGHQHHSDAHTPYADHHQAAHDAAVQAAGVDTSQSSIDLSVFYDNSSFSSSIDAGSGSSSTDTSSSSSF